MRPVVVQMGVTLDGFVHGEKGYEDWEFRLRTTRSWDWKAASLRDAGRHITGPSHVRGNGGGVAHGHGVCADVMNEIHKGSSRKTLTAPTGRKAVSPAETWPCSSCRPTTS